MPQSNKDTSGFTVWFTGYSGSGKTTLAHLLEKELRNKGLRVEVLDGDIVRTYLSKELGYSKEDRDENVRRIGFVCNILSRNGIVALAAVVSPYREAREGLRREIEHFVEVYVKCPIEICWQRDVKGLYQRALNGEIQQFTGISDPYEEPLNPEIIVETDNQPPPVCVEQIINWLVAKGYV